MTDIKRYNVEVDPQDGPVSLWGIEDEKGNYVYYDDHAAIVAEKDARISEIEFMLQKNAVKDGNEIYTLFQQVRSLAAENAALTELYRKSVTDLDGMCFEMGMMRGEKSMEYPAPETPATDAVLREIRAQAVEEYAITIGAEENGAIYAARIRSGEQS